MDLLDVRLARDLARPLADAVDLMLVHVEQGIAWSAVIARIGPTSTGPSPENRLPACSTSPHSICM